MTSLSMLVSLPIADRRTSFAFYRDGLGFQPVGELAEDGLPEPLQFAVNDGLRLMLIPTGGFGWVIGDRTVAPRDCSECVLCISAATEAEVQEWVARAERAGGTVVTAPGHKPWGYVGSFTDPDGHLWLITAQWPPS